MSGPRPTLKLKFGKAASPSSPQNSPAPPPPEAPPAAAPAPKKLTIKLPGSKGSAAKGEGSQKPAASSSKKKGKAPAGEKTRAAPSKKRSRQNLEDEGEHVGSKATAPATNAAPTVKRIKFSSKPPPSLRLKSKGEPLKRGKGVGYDSEASDTEIDPAIEEQFILRMQPGEDCEYLRKAIEEKRFGPRSQGGADASIKPLTRDGRRVTVSIQGRLYAASLVDLPCIVEGMKSWDKRGWYKSADICQMLLVLGRINSEDEAHTYPLPKDVDENTWQYAHGITPPLRHVKRRRFRERISNRTIEAVELEVARLIQQDQEAIEPPEFEVMDYAQYNEEMNLQRREEGEDMVYDDEQDAEGEEEYYDTTMEGQDQGEVDDFEDALAAEMEAALAAGADGDEAEAATVPAEGEVEVEVDAEAEAATPNTKPSTGGETSGDESDESSDAQSDAEEEMDEDALEQQRQLQQQREEIADLEALIRTETVKWEQMTNSILKGKLGKKVQSLKQDLELKRVSIGEGSADA